MLTHCFPYPDPKYTNPDPFALHIQPPYTCSPADLHPISHHKTAIMEEMFSTLKDVVSDPLAALTALHGNVHDKGHHVLDLMKAHPWTTLGIATGTALVWSNLRSPWNLPPGEMFNTMIMKTIFFKVKKTMKILCISQCPFITYVLGSY